MKQCSACKEDKFIDQFHKRTDSVDGYYAQCKKCRNAKIRECQKLNPDVVKDAKRKYYASEKGKLQKKKEDAAYILSGKRAESENRRSLKPISEARKAARKRWADKNKHYFSAQRSLRRGLFRKASDFDKFVFIEAAALAAMRKSLTGIEWHVDHIVPVTKNGTSEFSNIQVVPAIWNRKKSNRTTQKFFG